MNIRQCRNFEDPERGHGYRSVSREILIYMDPSSNEILRAWTNPWTGEEVEVVHVANDPVNMRGPSYAYRADGSGYRFNGTFINGRVWATGFSTLFLRKPAGRATTRTTWAEPIKRWKCSTATPMRTSCWIRT